MRIQYEIGDFVERLDYIESERLCVRELKQDGVVVEPTDFVGNTIENLRWYEDFKGGKFLRFIDIAPSKHSMAHAIVVVNGQDIQLDPEIRYREALERDAARKAAEVNLVP